MITTSRMCGEPAWGVWRDEKIRKTCGGSLLDLLIHDLDFAVSCLGQPEDVKLHLNLGEYWEFELKYKNSPAGVSIRGGFLSRYMTFTAEYAAIFENGSIRFNSLQPEMIRIATDSGPEIIEVEGNGYVNELEYFAQCIKERKQPEKCPPDESLLAIQICRKLEESKLDPEN